MIFHTARVRKLENVSLRKSQSDTGRFSRLIHEPLESRMLLAASNLIDNEFPALVVRLGSEPTVSLQDSIDGGGDTDVFQITAQQTGKMIIRIDFDHKFGDLGLTITDPDGTPLGQSMSQNNFEHIVIPVEAQEQYCIIVSGAEDGSQSSSYDLEIENLAAPIPSGIYMAPSSDTGMSDRDNLTADSTPRFVIQGDLVDLNAVLQVPGGFEGDLVNYQWVGNSDYPDQNAADVLVDTGVEFSVQSSTARMRQFDVDVAGSSITLIATETGQLDGGDSLLVSDLNWPSRPERAVGAYSVTGEFSGTTGTGRPTISIPDRQSVLFEFDQTLSFQQGEMIVVKLSPAESAGIEWIITKADTPNAGMVLSGSASSLDSSGILFDFTPSALQDGLYFAAATARISDDMGGGSSRTQLSEPLWFTIDTTAPSASMPDLLSASDSGTNSNDKLTNLSNPVFSGLAETGSKVRIFANGELVGSAVTGSENTDVGDTRAGETASTNGLGLWKIRAEPLDDRAYQMRTEVEDPAGNISTRSGLHEIVIDTRTPQRPTIDLNNIFDTGMSDLDNVTNTPRGLANVQTQDEVTLAVTSDLGTQVLVKDGNMTVASFVSTGEDVITVNLDEGTHLLSAESTDDAGNRSVQAEELNLTIDRSVPLPSIPELASYSDTGVSGDGRTSKMGPAFVGTAEANAKVRIFADRGNGPELVGQSMVHSDESDGNSSDNRGIWEVTVEPLADGIYMISAEIEDLAGNISPVGQGIDITIDSSQPQRPTVDLPTLFDSGMSDLDNVTNTPLGMAAAQSADEVTLTVTSDVGTNVLLKDGNTVIATFTSTGEDTISVGLDDGTHLINAESTNAVGNTGRQSHELLLTIDRVAPFPSISVLADYSDTGNVGDNMTSKMQPAFVGTAEANAKVRIFTDRGDGPVLVGQGIVNSDESDGNPADNRGTWEVTVEPLADGMYTIKTEIEDLAGNISPAGQGTSLKIDSLPPQRPTVDLANPDDSGMSDMDDVTRGDPLVLPNTSVVDVRISAELDSTVFVKDGEQVIDTFAFSTALDAADGIVDGFLVRTIDFNTIETSFGIPAEGPHPIIVEAFDLVGNLSIQSEELLITVDLTAPDIPGQPDMLAASDTGMSNMDNVTNNMSPTFSGLAEANTNIRIYAQDVTNTDNLGAVELVGQQVVNSDESDGTPSNGLGIWEITVDPIDDGLYAFSVELEDLAGNVSQRSLALQAEIDTLAPNTPLLDIVEASDSGRNNSDDITNDTTLTMTMTTTDSLRDRQFAHLIPENLTFRIFILPESDLGLAESLLYDSASDDDSSLVDGLTSKNLLQRTLSTLPEGRHNLTLEVEDRAGNISEDFLLKVTIDVTAPEGTLNLHPESDSGIWGFRESMTDGITSDHTPNFSGTTEANALARIHVNGTSGETTIAVPLDGNDVFPPPDGYDRNYSLQSILNLVDGKHTVELFVEDVAGNGRDTVADSISIFVDTEGPRIANVTLNDDDFTSLFAPKPSGGPDPLIPSIVLHISDGLERTTAFEYSTLLEALILEEGNYQLVGDANGNIPIVDINILLDDDGPGQALEQVELEFAQPLPDDRYTLGVFDTLADPAGNPLDGESGAQSPFEGNDGLTKTNPIFPTGDGSPGGAFHARFTVDSRPEIGTWAAGSVWVDTNGNFTFDPENVDFVNRDVVYASGFTSDDLFAGNFVEEVDETADGFDKLAAYGKVDGQFRWIVDTNNDGVADINRPDPQGIIGLPFSANFDGNLDNGDEVGVFDGLHWLLDTNHDFLLDTMVVVTGTDLLGYESSEPAYTTSLYDGGESDSYGYNDSYHSGYGQQTAGSMNGYPFVGDFNGDGMDDLATFDNDVFQVSLAIGPATFSNYLIEFRFGFVGVRERPLAADMDMDGYDDIGLWVPDREGVTPRAASEWYFLISGGKSSVLDRITTTDDAIDGKPVIEFTPVPFGNDIFAQFGDEFSEPIVGNFDPPVLPVSSTIGDETTEDIDDSDRNSLDVNGDDFVTPLDALLVINEINASGARAITASNLDTNSDGFISPVDVLLVINFLNAQSDAAAQNQSASIAAATPVISTTATRSVSPAVQTTVIEPKESRTAVAHDLLSDADFDSLGDTVSQIAADVASGAGDTSHRLLEDTAPANDFTE